MASRNLGQLTLDLVLKLGGFQQGMDKAARITDARMRQIEKTVKQVGQVVGVAFVAASTAIAAGLKRAIDQADALNDLNVRLGISAEALSGWAYAAKQSGTDIDALEKGLKKLSKGIAEAVDADSAQGKLFAALDIEPIDKATGKLVALEKVLPQIANRFKELKDETLEANLAQELFGKSGTDLLEFLNLGAGGIEDMRDKLRDLGGELSQNTLRQADEFNDNLNDLRTATDGLFTSLSADLLPELNALTGHMVDAARDGSDLRGVVDGLVKVFSYLGGILRDIDAYTRGLTSAFIGLYNAVDALSALNPGPALAKWMGGFGDSLSENWREAKAAAEQAGEAFGKVGEDYEAAAAKISRPAGFGKGIRGGGGKGFGGDDPGGNGDRERALLALLGGEPPKPKSGKSGKSDAEKEAEQLEAAYQRLNAQMAESIALFDQTTEVAKVRYDLEHGELSKLTDAKKAELLAQAGVIDQLKEEKEEKERLQKIDEERLKTIEQAHEALDGTLEDMQFEIDLLGKSNAERIAEIELRRIGIGLSEDERVAAKAAIVAKAEELESLSKTVDALDNMRDSAVDAFMAIADGSETGISALKKFGDAFAQQIQRMSAEYLSSALFGEKGTTGGGLFGNLLGSLFGGGSSGSTPSFGIPLPGSGLIPGFAEGTNNHPGGWSIIGEEGPEAMYVPRGAQIVPNDEMDGLGAGMTQENHFHLGSPTELRTQQQIAARVGFEARRASRRNGVPA